MHRWTEILPVQRWNNFTGVSPVQQCQIPNLNMHSKCWTYQTSAFSGKLPFPGSWFPGSQISPGKLNFPESQIFLLVTIFGKKHFPGSPLSWAVAFPGKSHETNERMSKCPNVCKTPYMSIMFWKNWWKNDGRRTDRRRVKCSHRPDSDAAESDS